MRFSPPSWLYVALAALAFSASAPLAKVARAIHPVGIAAGRTAIAAAVIAILWPRPCFGALRSLDAREARALFGAGTLLALHFALFQAGLASTSLPAAMGLVALEPLSVVLVSWLAFGARPTRREALGVAVATVGAFVVGTQAGAGEHRLLGDVLVLGAVVLYGGYVAAARGLRNVMPALPYAASVYGICALVLAPFVWLTLPMRGVTSTSVLALVGVGLVPTLVGHTLVQTAARKLRPSTVAIVSPGETVGAIAIDVVVTRTLPGSIEGVGVALVLGGALLAIFGRVTAVPVGGSSPATERE